MQLHGEVCDALSLDDLSFQYQSGATASPGPAGSSSSRNFRAVIARQEGAGSFVISLSSQGPGQPILFRVDYDWPPSVQLAQERFDLVQGAVLNTLVPSADDWLRIAAEVRVRAQCDTRSGDSLEFMKGHVLGLHENWLKSLGQPVGFATVQLELAPTDSPPAPKREFKMEVLREDRRSLYLEFMSQWAKSPTQAPVDYATEKPSHYVADVHGFMVSSLSNLSEESK